MLTTKLPSSLTPCSSRLLEVLTRPHFAWSWLAAQVITLWPTWLWMSKRMSDGSDDPLGILALVMLGITVWQLRQHFNVKPRLIFLLFGLVLTLFATLMFGKLPALMTGIISMLAITTTLLALLPRSIAKTPFVGLSILALPILSSLQFYAGYPLRVITAEVSSWLLAFFYEIQREGSALLINGQLIMVDAPCSGVQMAWFGYFTACTIALWQRLSDRQFLFHLPLVGILVLGGNILRNSILVTLQTSKPSLPEWLHQGTGLLILGIVCTLVICLMGVEKTIQQTKQETSNLKEAPSRSFLCAGLSFFLLCSVWSIHHAQAISPFANNISHFVEWPHEWQGMPLRLLTLSEVEVRFANNFPGSITRMTDGDRVFVFRHVMTPTRKLHPAADCYKGLGYIIRNEMLQSDREGLLWRCFVATSTEKSLQVCERIEDMQGQSYTDTSAWYWSALLNPDTGPWITVTIAQDVNSGVNTAYVTE